MANDQFLVAKRRPLPDDMALIEASKNGFVSDDDSGEEGEQDEDNNESYKSSDESGKDDEDEENEELKEFNESLP